MVVVLFARPPFTIRNDSEQRQPWNRDNKENHREAIYLRESRSTSGTQVRVSHGFDPGLDSWAHSLPADFEIGYEHDQVHGPVIPLLPRRLDNLKGALYIKLSRHPPQSSELSTLYPLLIRFNHRQCHYHPKPYQHFLNYFGQSPSCLNQPIPWCRRRPLCDRLLAQPYQSQSIIPPTLASTLCEWSNFFFT